MLSPLNQRLKIQITQIILLALFYLLLATSFIHAQSAKYIRVAIMQDVISCRLKIRGTYEIIDSTNNKVLNRGKNLNTTVAAYSGGILLGNIRSDTDKLFIESYGHSAIINGRLFRGNIQFIKDNGQKFWVINHIDLEDYIKGISVRELSHYWPRQALKAHVIVFRTFALYKMQENSQKNYDLTSDIYSQVYGGKAAERYRVNKVVEETQDSVLTYQGKIFPAFYHATCGGHTEDASSLWNINIAPLKGVACGFCRDSPHFKWHNVLSVEKTKDSLRKAGYRIENIKDITILGRNKSDRITELKIVTDKKDISITAKDFRNILGPNIIRSTNFNVDIVDNELVFEGYGWGHGVGLCQWGGYFMAKGGYTHQEILKYYYPGAEVSSYETLRF